ncbi:sensor domain-containing diguanylate cyclase [Paenibacillus hexagrammi]|uniref:Diguanylate cyclase n=1 Tax=Paenibacillus hexagrammi TaxID=2908839 RepID=A0ABY3SHE4_9BACL|nr:diguanylate cyclase [Paenibacillus sp. YPD9-1]UJF32530.1 diguanylate cyclase [Paenibacillus sp. YPD9-1]
MLLHTSFPFSTLFSFFIFIILMLYSMRFRNTTGANYFIFTMFLNAILALASIGELTSTDMSIKLMWRNLEQIPLFASPITVYGMIMELTGIDVQKVRKHLFWLSIPCAIYLLLIFTDSTHHLMRSYISIEPFGGLSRIHVQSTSLGLLFIGYTRAIGLFVIGRLILSLRSVFRYNRIQYGLILASTVIPFILTFLTTIMDIEVSVSASAVPGGLLLGLAIFHYKLLRVRPMVKDLVIEHMREGVVVLDPEGIVLDLNPSAVQIIRKIGIHLHSNKILGHHINVILEERPDLLERYEYYESKDANESRFDAPPYHYSVSYIPILSRNRLAGSVLICTDISERVAYESELLRQATVDGLTQVYNRQYMLETSNNMLKEYTVISFMLIDIDYFKSINDQYGHQAGDYALTQVAALIQETAEQYGIVGRMGGEEFAITLPNMDMSKALWLAELIRQRVEQAIFTGHNSVTMRCTVSIGVTAKKDNQTSFTELYQEADDRLYRSKHKGRNQVTTS